MGITIEEAIRDVLTTGDGAHPADEIIDGAIEKSASSRDEVRKELRALISAGKVELAEEFELRLAE